MRQEKGEADITKEESEEVENMSGSQSSKLEVIIGKYFTRAIIANFWVTHF